MVNSTKINVKTIKKLKKFILFIFEFNLMTQY